MSPHQNLDPAALERLQRLGDRAFVCKMIDLFLDYVATKIAEAWAAHASGNCPAVEKAVHPIKSSAGNIGASQVRELAARIEELAQEADRQALATSLRDLEAAFAAVKPELEARRRSLLEPTARPPQTSG
jgi:HPt (histidine-containing phosphotransfer) domain-containing protein